MTLFSLNPRLVELAPGSDPKMERFCLDTNAFIEPWQKYPADIFGSFYWDFILHAWKENKKVFSSAEVLEELSRCTDGLYVWAQGNSDLFLPLSEEIQDHTRLIVLARFPSLIDPDGTFSAADPFVISLAALENATVVTQEKLNSKVRPNIPHVCQALGIPCISLFDFMRKNGIQFQGSRPS